MLETLSAAAGVGGGLPVAGILFDLRNYFLIFAGFSLVIFFHELGHFLVAKFCNVRVEKFAVGFGRPVFSYRRRLGLRWGSNTEEYRRRMYGFATERGLLPVDANPSDAELAVIARDLKLGETEYCFNWLPLGGYVKMLGQEDFAVDKSGELRVKKDPRAFTHKPVGQRMAIVSAGVVMNLVFAALVFMIAFLIGVEFPAAEVGFVQPDSPAERAGLQVGDKILAIDGQQVSDFWDVSPAIMLSDPHEPSHIKVQRAGAGGEPTEMTLTVQPVKNQDENKLQIGIGPPFTTKVADILDDPQLPAKEQVRRGDVIQAVDGRKVTSFYDLNNELISLRGEWGDVTALRTGADGKQEVVHAKRRARLLFRPMTDVHTEMGDLLGLVPRRVVMAVNPDEPADRAGFKSGDVIVRWGNQIAPTRTEIYESVKSNPDRNIRVTVLRPEPGGEAKTLSIEVQPKIPGFFKSGAPKIGMAPEGQETERLVVADIVTGDKEKTPAAALKGVMPRGALVTKVDGQPVKTWTELVTAFTKLGGKDVKLTWTYEGQPEQSASIHVPATLGTVFPLPAGAKIAKIDGVSTIEVMENGRPQIYRADDWRGARDMMSKSVGKTIAVEYRGAMDKEAQVAKVTVTPEMLNPWPLRVEYSVLDNMITEMAETRIQAKSPAKAMLIGVRKTYYFIEQVYMMMKRMIITRTVGFEQMSGPVGIVKMGSDIAGEGFVKLLYFLGLISANLAVINFLPLPIVDGGLLVFLLVEKIKGSPISIRVQMATQVIGLMLIIGIFIFVTFQDVQRLFG